ncbi:MAG: hypothetical protein VX410_02785 [Actinomycetota bacterium]|nr:hypothetical protein [Actinomycetota bacterium]
MRFVSSLVAIVMLTVACGGDGSEDLAEKLVAANEEITELENRVEQLLDWEFELREQLLAKSRRELGQPFESWNEPRHDIFSHGPCGSFVLDGGRLLKLEYDESYFAPPGEYWFNGYEDELAFERSSEWVDTGVLLADPANEEFHKLQSSRYWRFGAPPNKVFSVEVAPDRNPFFWAQWFLDFEDWPPFPPVNLSGDPSFVHGFFGVDDDCNWGWVPLVWAHLLEGDGPIDLDEEWNRPIQSDSGGWLWRGSSKQGIEVAQGDVLKTFRLEGGYACRDISPAHDMGQVIAEYDPAQHLFIAHCVENDESLWVAPER